MREKKAKSQIEAEEEICYSQTEEEEEADRGSSFSQCEFGKSGERARSHSATAAALRFSLCGNRSGIAIK